MPKTITHLERTTPMGKYILILILLIGQEGFSQAKSSLGFKGGVNFANAITSGTGTSVESVSGRTSFLFGGFLDIEISKLLSIQPELLYIRKAAGGIWLSTGMNTEYHFDFLAIPALLKMNFGSDEFKPYVFIGPNIGILVSAQVENKFTSGRTQTLDIKQNAESIDFAIDIGAGMEYSINKNNSILSELRYSRGLTNTTKKPPSSNSWYSTGIQLLIGMKFSL
jgi:opacity protein-like surface antigen